MQTEASAALLRNRVDKLVEEIFAGGIEYLFLGRVNSQIVSDSVHKVGFSETRFAVDEQRVEKFGVKFDEQFGKNTELTPSSVVNVKKFELNTPDISIKVNPERKDLVSTQVINGVRYIMIRANEGVEVNGVSINIE